jgi:RNA polymerase sigma factor (sigma-70 family)
MARKKATVTWQDGSTDPYNEKYQEHVGRDYWSHMETKTPFGRGSDGELIESVSANPDFLSDDDVKRRVPHLRIRGNAQPSAEEILLEEAKTLLTEKQAQVWQALMVDEYTGEEASEVLGISQQMVSKHLSAARKKVESYLIANAHRIKR